MYDLILSMIKANEDYENELNFTKSDIVNFMKKYNFKSEIEECNEIGWIILLRNKYITNEEFAKLMDVEYKEDKFWLVIDSFDNILSDKYETEIKILNQNDDNEWWDVCNYYEVSDIESYYWSIYTEDTLKNIIKYCIDNGIEIENEDGKDELMTDENTYLKQDKKGINDIYFKYENGEEVNLSSLLDDDEFEELKTILNSSICEAQDDADKSEIYNDIMKEFESSIGVIKRDTIKQINYKGEEHDIDKIYINLDKLKLSDVESFLQDDYEEYDFESKNYGSLIHILKEMEYFEFRTPDYNNVYGSIDNDILNEYTLDRLNE